jgi:hypothetical protein
VAYFASNPATAHQLYNTFWQCVDELSEKGFTVDYVMMDGASTNRLFTSMLFQGKPPTTQWMFRDIYNRQHTICAIQDIMHCIKKTRNNIESSKVQNKSAPGRYLILNDRPILWDHWEAWFRFNCQSGFRIHRNLTREHIEMTPASKMRNKLATDVLSKDMLYLMKSYQQTLEDPGSLASSVALLEQTSILIDIFCDRNRPISDMSDNRINQIATASKFFLDWEKEVIESVLLAKSKNYLTKETSEDIQSALMGFVSLCGEHVSGGNTINPGYMNSDIVENLFCQQRGIRNGLNTNPTVSQYGPANTAIILGQATVSNKSNSGGSATYFTATTKRALKHPATQCKKMKSIRV